MPTLNFYLKHRPTRKGTHVVQLVYQHKGQKLRLKTPVRIEQKQWDPRRQRVKAQAAHAIELNAILEKELYRVQQAQIRLQLEGEEPFTERMRQRLAPALKPQAQFENAVQEFGRSRSGSVWRKYRVTLERFQEYLRERKHSMAIPELTPLVYEQYGNWLNAKGTMADNTVTKAMQIVKTFLAWCAKMGYLERFESRQYTTGKSRQATHVALTEAELAALEDLYLAPNTPQESARDVFCFGCYTGLRYSDIECLMPENVQEQVLDGQVCRVLKIQIVKTKEPLIVPLSDRALALLEKHAYHLPVLNATKMNGLIKEVCEEAGIRQRVQMVSYRGGQRVEETKPKWQCVSTHTARRTFATLSWIKGMSLPTLQRILGHAKIEQTMAYIKEVEGQTSREMRMVWG